MPKKTSGNKGKKSGSVMSGHRQLHVNVKTAKKRKSSSTKWLARQLNDPYVLKAKADGYRCRSAYKLIEVNNKFKIIKPNSVIVDLGAAPGGWLQVAREIVKTGALVAIDLQEIAPIPGVITIQHDFMDEEAPKLLKEKLSGRKPNLILSDMAAAACGHTATDHLRIMALCEVALDFAINNLEKNGGFVTKMLQGGGENNFLNLVKQHFSIVKNFKPESSRKDSAETFLVALGFKGKA